MGFEINKFLVDKREKKQTTGISIASIFPEEQSRPLLEDVKQGFQNLITGLGNIPRILPKLDPTRQLKKAFFPEIVEYDDNQLSAISDNIRAWAKTNIPVQPETGRLAKPVDLTDPADLFDARRIFKVAAENIPLMGSFIAATMLNPIVGLGMMFGVEGGSTVEAFDKLEAEGKEIDPLYRDFAPIVVGTFNAALERVGIKRILDLNKVTGLKSRLLHAVTTSFIEGGTEGLQEANQILAEVGAGDRFDESDWDRLVESTYAGIVLGFVGGGASQAIGALTATPEDPIFEQLTQEFQETFKDDLARPDFPDVDVSMDRALEAIAAPETESAIAELQQRMGRGELEEAARTMQEILTAVSPVQPGDIVTFKSRGKTIFKNRRVTRLSTTGKFLYTEGSTRKFPISKMTVTQPIRPVVLETGNIAGEGVTKAGIDVADRVQAIEDQLELLDLQKKSNLFKALLSQQLREEEFTSRTGKKATPEALLAEEVGIKQVRGKKEVTPKKPVVKKRTVKERVKSPRATTGPESELEARLAAELTPFLEAIGEDPTTFFGGVKSAVKGVGEILGGSLTELSSGIAPFTEEGYARARPHFIEALRQFKGSLEAFKAAQIAKRGEGIIPYLDRFEKEVAVIGATAPDDRPLKNIMPEVAGEPLQEQMSEKKIRDLLNTSELIRSPENLLDRAGFTEALAFSTRIITADLKQSFAAHKNLADLRLWKNRIVKAVGKKNAEKVFEKDIKQILDLMQDKNLDKLEQIKTDNPEVFAVAKEIDSFLARMREKMRLFHREISIKNLDEKISTAFQQTLDSSASLAVIADKVPEKKLIRQVKAKLENVAGLRKTEVAALFRGDIPEGLPPDTLEKVSEIIDELLPRSTVKGSESEILFADIVERNNLSLQDELVLREAILRYNIIDTWLLDNYIPNLEAATIKLVDKDGNLLAVAITPTDAAFKASKLAEEDPSLGTIFVEGDFPSIQAISSDVSKTTIRKISEGAKREIDSIIATIQPLVDIPLKQKFTPIKLGKEAVAVEGDLFDTLTTYAAVIEKKIALDPVIHDMRKAINEDKTGEIFPPNVKKLLINQMEATKGRYSAEDQFFDGLVDKFSDSKLAKSMGLDKVTDETRPLIFSRFVSSVRQFEGMLKLGYRPVAAFINLVSGFGHTWTKLGTEYMRKGFAFNKTPEGKQFIADNKALLAMDFVADVTGKLHTRLPWWHPLKMFGAPEPLIREHSLSANYLYALEKMNMSPDAALEFAGKSSRYQNFAYNTSTLPRLLRSPGGKLVGQFKTYMVKELEFINALQGNEWLRYAGMQMSLAGPRGLVYMMRSIPFLLPLGLADATDEWLEKNAKIGDVDVSRGLPGLIGADITAPAVVQLPNKPEDLAGPFIADLTRLVTRVLYPLWNGEDYVFPPLNRLGEVAQPGPSPFKAVNWAKGLAPAMYYWDQVVQSFTDPEGWILDSRGNRLYQASGWYDRMLLMSGASTVKGSKTKVALNILRNEEIKIRRNRTALIKDVVFNFMDKGRNIPPEVLGKFEALGMTSLASFVSRLKISKMTPKERSVQRSLIFRKARAEGIFVDFE